MRCQGGRSCRHPLGPLWPLPLTLGGAAGAHPVLELLFSPAGIARQLNGLWEVALAHQGSPRVVAHPAELGCRSASEEQAPGLGLRFVCHGKVLGVPSLGLEGRVSYSRRPIRGPNSDCQPPDLSEGSVAGLGVFTPRRGHLRTLVVFLGSWLSEPPCSPTEAFILPP